MKKIYSLLCCFILLTACTSVKKYEKNKIFLGTILDSTGSMVLLLNTEVYLTCVDKDKENNMVNSAKDIITTCHILLDSHHEYNIDNLYTLNHDRIVTDDTNILLDAIEFSIKMSKLTKGYFNPTIGNVFKLYEGKFYNFDYECLDPDNVSIQEAINTIVPYDELEEYIIIDRQNSSITLLPYKGQEYTIDLGAISKGYIVDKVYEELVQYDSSFLLSAGSSSVVSYTNDKEGISWNVGYRDPDNSNDYLFAYNINDKAVSSSGDSQQYYINKEGVKRSHILNPYTGYSESFYRTLVLLSNSNASGILDGLSTALFNIGDINEIKEIISNVSSEFSINIDYAFQYTNNDILMNNDFKSLLLDDYSSNKINIVLGE